ncbi:MAG TPA: transglycosylase SLT domain-containing protein [Actinomycetota bacterium]|nr:transglycosylase SLT domain-containing protein [Actinomycetota bacterium]
MRFVAGLLAASVLAVACGQEARTAPSPEAPPPSSAAPTVVPEPTPTLLPSPSVSPVPPQEKAFVPRPNAALPRSADRLARALAKVTRALRTSVTRWIRDGDINDRPPRRVVLQALYQQRIYRVLMRDERLARRTFANLPARFRPGARANVAAGSRLLSLVTPISRPTTFKTGPAKPAGTLLRWFREAERRFDVAWEVLAAVMYVESKFGKVKSTSTAGAQGPMQFLPSTWEQYGMGGDIQDPHDAILGAANYLHASGAPGDYRRALFAYNRSMAYVDAVLIHANEIRKDRRNYFIYYNWQVFVVTTKGDKRLTGPDLD